MEPKTIGVLALQGAFIEHIVLLEKALKELEFTECKIIQVRTPQELNQCNALVIPGGESTAMSLIAERNGMLEPLREFTQNPQNPVWGTCAGLIFCASEIKNSSVGQKTLNCLDITVTRNAFGAQLDSFTQNLDFSHFISNCTSFPAVFIRAPVVSHTGAKVKTLYQLDASRNNLVVAVQQGNKLGTSFHPELTEDCAVHRYFVEIVLSKRV